MKRKTIMAAASLLLILTGTGATAYGAAEHREIMGPFASPMDVTKKCLECHENAAHDIMQTSHWTWELEQDIAGQGNMYRGKKNVINNFCISINGNWPRCTSCHIGSYMKSPTRDYDVHMGRDGEDFSCQSCHTTARHDIKGNAMVVSPGGRNHIACTECHGTEPHGESLLKRQPDL